LRAEILFNCKLNPWLTIGELSQRQLACLSNTIPRLTRAAYKRSATATEKDRQRMANDPSLVYQPRREYGTRHMVFRRTNLPCLRCGKMVQQLRQRTTQTDEDAEERTRIVYFCAKCQRVEVDPR
jgi:formamidopyrimidine-DNA glycosylase